MQVSLFKRDRSYEDKTSGESRSVTDFYICVNGDMKNLVPVSIKYFGKEGKPDSQYSGRKMLLSTVADSLPEKAVSELKSVSSSTDSVDGDIPF